MLADDAALGAFVATGALVSGVGALDAVGGGGDGVHAHAAERTSARAVATDALDMAAMVRESSAAAERLSSCSVAVIGRSDHGEIGVEL